MNFKFLFTAAVIAATSQLGFAQGADNYGSGLKVNLNPEGTKYVRFLIWNQVWARYNQNNPNTLVNGNPENATTDIGIRRARFLSYAQISPRFLILTHFGINNQTFTNGGAQGSSGTGGYGMGKKPGIFIHDAWTEYALILPDVTNKKDYSLNMGAGIHYFNGISRMTNASTLNFLTIDAPVFNWPLIENSDQFARQMGIFFKGHYKKLNYQVSFNKPFATNLEGNYDAKIGSIAVDNNGASKMAYQSYVDYNFFDKESNFLPFKVGTYLGSKKVLSVGAGFYHQPEATQSKTAAGVIQKHNTTLFGLDVFADLPIGDKKRNAAITAYSVFYNFYFGPNYIRNIGIMNPASGLDPAGTKTSAIMGAGNARVLLGTGNIWYTQLGYLIPKGLSQKSDVRLQPFLAYTYKDLQYHNLPGSYFDIGANILLNGHHAKITPQLSLRPMYYSNATGFYKDGFMPEFLLQFQIYL